MAKLDWKSSSIFKLQQRQIKDYNPAYNLIDVCVAGQTAPVGATTNDCYYYTGLTTATVFGISGVSANSFMVLAAGWNVFTLSDVSSAMFKSWVISESFTLSNITYDSAGVISGGVVIWPDSDVGSISNVVVGSFGITSVRYNRSTAGIYATVAITYDAIGNFLDQTVTLIGF